MLSRKLLRNLVFLGGCLIISSSQALAVVENVSQPSIISISGIIDNGSAITIQGSSFGANGPNILLFDDFESGTDSNNIKTGTGSATIGKWDVIGGGDGSCLPKYDSTFAHSGNKSYKADYTIKTNSGTDANCTAFVNNLNIGDVFLSYWVYLPTTSIFPCYGGIGSKDCNWKMAWLYGSNTGYDDQVVPVGLPGGANPPYSDWALSCNGCYNKTANWFNLDMQKGKWYRIWAWIHGTSDATGHKEMWVMSKDDNIPLTNKVNWNGQVFNTGGYFRNFAISAWARWCYNCVESAPRFDDVYLAIGQSARARVEIGNDPDYHKCTNLTIATVTSWSDTLIHATLRKGSFETFNNAYLFVIDSGGNVSSGKPLCLNCPQPPIITNIK